MASEAFEEIHQVILDGIIDNMVSLVQYDNCGAINRIYYTTMGYYVMTFVSEA